MGLPRSLVAYQFAGSSFVSYFALALETQYAGGRSPLQTTPLGRVQCEDSGFAQETLLTNHSSDSTFVKKENWVIT